MAPAGAHLQRRSAGQPVSAGPGQGWEVSPREGLGRRAPQGICPRVRSPGKVSGLSILRLQPVRTFAPGQRASGEAPSERTGPDTGTGLGRPDARRSPMLRQLRLHNFRLS
ncbi:hypothetical protein NDU88_008565 [Pleurodeles waltl]|uniref:Uncharacterized protein n=1 Tax=Pleurodeles waltl TaxID=8319 RepID=A0AAV7P5F7_PLEWA|nr:hypothetical protein NDU88_008565 [Pleurodeles waltl]